MAASSRQQNDRLILAVQISSRRQHGPRSRLSIMKSSRGMSGKALAVTVVLEQSGCKVRSTDLYERGYGQAGHDFLKAAKRAGNIVTNPPYNCAEGFVASGVKLAERKFALLLRLAFLEGAHRANTIFSRIPPSRVWVFSERITFYMKGAKQAGSGTTAYAWFVWDKDAPSGTELKWFKPGYKARFA